MTEIKKLYAFVVVKDDHEMLMVCDGVDLTTNRLDVAERAMAEIKKLKALDGYEIRLVEFERKEGFEVI